MRQCFPVALGVVAILALALGPTPVLSDPLFAAPDSFTTGGGPNSVAVGELNGDGRPDLATANRDGWSVSVLLGDGDGTFGPKTDLGPGTYWNAWSVAIGDLNADGRADLVVADYGSSSVSVLLGNGNGTFGARTDFATGSDPFSVAIGDLDADGKPDLAVADYGSSKVSVLLGHGDGTFGTKTDLTVGSHPAFVAIGDLNGDRDRDLVVANYNSDSVSVLLGNGHGTFATRKDFACGPGPYSVAIGDLNGDGRPDLATANAGHADFGSSVSVLLGNGDGTFGPKTDFGTGTAPLSVAIGDLNGDARPDLAAASWGSNSVSVLLGNGDGTFGAKMEYAAGSHPRAVAIADLDGDGRPDLATTNEGSGTLSVLLNIGTSTSGIGQVTADPPRVFQLLPPNPSPSRGPSEIRYRLPAPCAVDVSLFDLAGRRVRTLVAGEPATSGEHGVRWDGRDDSGIPMREGVYLVQVRAGRHVGVRKLVVLR